MQNTLLNHAAQMLEESKGDMENKWLTFWIDKQLFGVSIINVEQIVSMQPITEVPEYPSYAKGIISSRGKFISGVDAVLNIPCERIARPPEMGADTANHHLNGVARLFDDNGANEKIVLCLDAAKVLRQDEQTSLIR